MTDPFAFDEQPRPLRYGNEQRDPLSVLLTEIRLRQEQLSAVLAAIASDQFALRQAAEEAARAGDAHANEWAAVNIVADRMGELLNEHGVTLDDPTGGAWSDTMRQKYDLLGHTQRADITEPRVAHAINPAVHRHGQLIKKGQVMIDAPLRGGSADNTNSNTPT